MEKERPIRNKNLREAIEESKKEAESKKVKAEREKRKSSRARFRRSASPYRKRSKSPRERRRDHSPESRYSRSGRRRFGFDKDKTGCFNCGSSGHRARECPDKRSK